ncbi:MAG TPA: hypothetical protein VND65_23290 [Candidatus Binatia bacterium]|nr:hypothetical protein [Candidatus Binatia bacterium]
MSNTLTIRFSPELLDRLREKSRRTGLPMGRMVQRFVENGLSEDSPDPKKQAWRKYAGIFKDGPPDLSTRKGYSRK